MIYCVERIGNEDPYKYKVLYNYGAYKREYVGNDKLPKTVREFINNSSQVTASQNYVPWVTYYK